MSSQSQLQQCAETFSNQLTNDYKHHCRWVVNKSYAKTSPKTLLFAFYSYGTQFAGCIALPVTTMCGANVGRVACMEGAISLNSIWPECKIECMWRAVHIVRFSSPPTADTLCHQSSCNASELVSVVQGTFTNRVIDYKSELFWIHLWNAKALCSLSNRYISLTERSLYLQRFIDDWNESEVRKVKHAH